MTIGGTYLTGLSMSHNLPHLHTACLSAVGIAALTGVNELLYAALDVEFPRLGRAQVTAAAVRRRAVSVQVQTNAPFHSVLMFLLIIARHTEVIVLEKIP